MKLNNLLESANPWRTMQDDAGRLSSKWEKTGLLEGLDSDVKSNNMSMILENQAKQLVVEVSRTGGSANFTPGTGETWAGVALPLVRKVFGQIAAQEFVSVQPMNLPSGLVFYLDFQYGTSKSVAGRGDVQNTSLYGTTDQPTNAAGGLYGAGKFTYSENQFSASLTPVSSGSATWGDVNFDGAMSASVDATQLWKMTFATSSMTNLDAKGVKGFVASSGSLTEAS